MNSLRVVVISNEALAHRRPGPGTGPPSRTAWALLPDPPRETRPQPRPGVIILGTGQNFRKPTARISGTHILITNLPFSDWPTIFPNEATAIALIDRLVHHAVPRSSRLKGTATDEASPRPNGSHRGPRRRAELAAGPNFRASSCRATWQGPGPGRLGGARVARGEWVFLDG